jgi:hypothetical protein
MGACRRLGDDVDLADRQRRRRPGERSATDPGRPRSEHVGLDLVHGAKSFIEQQQYQQQLFVHDEHLSVILVFDVPGRVVD